MNHNSKIQYHTSDKLQKCWFSGKYKITIFLQAILRISYKIFYHHKLHYFQTCSCKLKTKNNNPSPNIYVYYSNNVYIPNTVTSHLISYACYWVCLRIEKKPSYGYIKVQFTLSIKAVTNDNEKKATTKTTTLGLLIILI